MITETKIVILTFFSQYLFQHHVWRKREQDEGVHVQGPGERYKQLLRTMEPMRTGRVSVRFAAEAHRVAVQVPQHGAQPVSQTDF